MVYGSYDAPKLPALGGIYKCQTNLATWHNIIMNCDEMCHPVIIKLTWTVELSVQFSVLVVINLD